MREELNGRIDEFMGDVFRNAGEVDKTLVFSQRVLDEHRDPVSESEIKFFVSELKGSFRKKVPAVECWLYVWYDALIGQVRAGIVPGAIG